MLSGQSVLSMTNYVNAADVFGDTQIKGGICHYLVDKLAGRQKCDYSLFHDKRTSVCEKRDMSDFDILIRDPRTDAIVKKVLKVAEANGEGFVSTIISAKPSPASTLERTSQSDFPASRPTKSM